MCAQDCSEVKDLFRLILAFFNIDAIVSYAKSPMKAKLQEIAYYSEKDLLRLILVFFNVDGISYAKASSMKAKLQELRVYPTKNTREEEIKF